MRGNEAQLATAVANLVDNAIAYSGAGTRVAVTARASRDDDARPTVDIAVTDQGIGIADAERDRIFERFYRVDPARSRATGGTGLGLAIVKNIVTNHLGDGPGLEQPGSGSTFTIRLPRVHSDRPSSAPTDGVPEPSRRRCQWRDHARDTHREGSRMTRVLVVEDEESFSDALSYMLRREGYEVEVAGTGHDALQSFERTGADLVLLDLMLPGLSGTEVCRELRTRSHVPIIMVTARDAEVDKVVGLELGADDYVTKPFSSRELVARIRAVLRRRAEPEELLLNVVEAGPVRMDVERHVVRSTATRYSCR